MDIRMSNIASPMPQVRAKFTNKLGIPLSGCKVYTYEPNSDIPKTTWLDTDKTTENTNPILLDAAGEADIFIDGLYRVVVKDRFGFVVYDVEKTGNYTQWDASFIVDGDENQHEINRTTARSVNTIADLMSLQNPKNDQVVSVKGYYAPTNFALAQPFKGGGVFFYVSDLSTINNSVTIFNGWVRVLSNSTLSTYDAGLVGDISIDGLDSYEKLQALLDAAPESSTINLHGEFITSAELFAKDKKSITILGNGSLIKADSTNWVKTRSVGKYYVHGISYATLDSVTTTAGTYNTGIINFIGCGTVVVENTHIYGASLPVYLEGFQMVGFQAGDAGITAWACENVNINGCVIDHVFTWGILGGSVTRCNVNNNAIRNCVHQSGISMNIPAASNQSKVDIYSNYIEDTGLYGIELENHSESPSKANVYDNTLIDCFSGVTAVGKAYKFRIYDNYAYNCNYGTWLIQLTSTLPAEVYNNTYTGCYYGVIWQGSNIKANIHKNHTDGTPDEIIYRKTSADNIVWSIVDNKTFMHPSALTVGKTYYIDGVAVVISSSTASGQYVRNDTGNRELYTIVTTQAVITSTMKFKHVKAMLNTESVGEAGYVSATAALDVLCFNNHATNVNYGLLCDGVAGDATKQERFLANTLGRCIYQAVRVNNSGNLSRYFADNINVFNKISVFNDLVKTGFIKLKQLESHTLAGTISTTENSVTKITYPANPLYSVIPNLQIHAIRVVLYGQNLASDAVIRLTITNGGTATTYTASLSSFNQTASALFIMSSAFITSEKTWGYTAVVDNEAKTLTYTSARLFYLTD